MGFRGWSAATRLHILMAIGVGLLLAACQSPAPDPETGADAEIDPSTRERAARHLLETGRALRAEGRPDAAERVLRRGLTLDPGNAGLERALAHALDAQGRQDEARAARARADALDPPPQSLADTPLPGAGAGLLVALLKSEDPDLPETLPRWPEAPIADALAARVGARLPRAPFERADPERVSSALDWLEGRNEVAVLSVRIDRAWCGFTVKDGRLAVADLRAAVAVRGVPPSPGSEPISRHFQVVLEDPPIQGDCRLEAVARAFDAILAAHPGLGGDAERPVASNAAWQPADMRTLFPGIGRQVLEALRAGRTLLAAGQLGEAQRAFERALAIDPTDSLVRSYLDDARRSVALAREIARNSASGLIDTDSIDPQLSPGQRAAAEAALEREERRRQELLATLAVLDEDLYSPPPTLLATLRPAEIRERDAFGPRLARKRARAGVEARAAYAPDGSVLARYYFGRHSPLPVVREEDTDGDGQPDRWITYRGSARSEIFEDGGRRGIPDLRLSFGDGGTPLVRVEFDRDGDGEPDRVFLYREGTLHAEKSDTDGDGVLDRFDQLDAEGRVDLREEDIDGDGEIDVRSVYRGGKLVRREISDPAHLPES